MLMSGGADSLAWRPFGMPARDRYHDCVRNALIKDGWVITHDPLRLPWGKKDLYVDLGASSSLAAEKGERRIAVEIKSFLGKSEIDDLEKALGQFALYRSVLARREPDRTLFLAVPDDVLATYSTSRRTIDRERLIAPNLRIRPRS